MNSMQSNSTRTARQWIDALELQPHPEGGHYSEFWRSQIRLPGTVLGRPDETVRNAGTAIHFLLTAEQESRAHKVSSDELWILIAGDPLLIESATTSEGPWAPVTLSHEGTQVQALVPANTWQRARPASASVGWTLCVCVVVPGFDFADFEMA